MVDTNDEWISVRTGIRNRRVLSGEFILALHKVPSAINLMSANNLDRLACLYWALDCDAYFFTQS